MRIIIIYTHTRWWIWSTVKNCIYMEVRLVHCCWRSSHPCFFSFSKTQEREKKTENRQEAVSPSLSVGVNLLNPARTDESRRSIFYRMRSQAACMECDGHVVSVSLSLELAQETRPHTWASPPNSTRHNSHNGTDVFSQKCIFWRAKNFVALSDRSRCILVLEFSDFQRFSICNNFLVSRNNQTKLKSFHFYYYFCHLCF